jgi:uncharacterized protein YmfQ (DUF2313 family)
MPTFADEDFHQAMLRLLPRGPAWRADPASNLSATLLGLAPTYTRSSAAAAQVLVDANPDTTENLLAEWEASLGLPDPCTAANPSLQQRQAAVRAKFGARGSLSVPFFIALAAELGFTITITEFAPFTAEMACDLPVTDAIWANVWQVSTTQITTFYFSADQSSADDPLESYDAGELICRITQNAPAETTVFFTFLVPPPPPLVMVETGSAVDTVSVTTSVAMAEVGTAIDAVSAAVYSTVSFSYLAPTTPVSHTGSWPAGGLNFVINPAPPPTGALGYFVYSTQNAVVPSTSGATSITYDNIGGGYTGFGEYLAPPSSAGTWYVWAIAKDSSGVLLGWVCSGAITVT